MTDINLYDVLGIKEDATDEEIKAAYKKRAKEAHPDKGGSDEEMTQVTFAYEVLSDKSRRARYDINGDTTPTKSFDEKMSAFISEVFMSIVDKYDYNTIENINVIKMLKNRTYNYISENKQNIGRCQDEIIKYGKVLKRLKSKNTVIQDQLTKKINKLNSEIKMAEVNIDFLTEALENVNDYHYDFNGGRKNPLSFLTE